MDIEGSPFQFSSAGNAVSSGFTTAIYGTAKLISGSSRSLFPFFPIGNKSESARKLLRLEVVFSSCLLDE